MIELYEVTYNVSLSIFSGGKTICIVYQSMSGKTKKLMGRMGNRTNADASAIGARNI